MHHLKLKLIGSRVAPFALNRLVSNRVFLISALLASAVAGCSGTDDPVDGGLAGAAGNAGSAGSMTTAGAGGATAGAGGAAAGAGGAAAGAGGAAAGSGGAAAGAAGAPEGAGGAAAGAGGAAAGAGGAAAGAAGAAAGAAGAAGAGGDDAELIEECNAFCSEVDGAVAICTDNAAKFGDVNACFGECYEEAETQWNFQCRKDHLVMAEGDPGMHCPHVVGGGPCADMN